MIDLTERLLEKQKARPLEVGRYSISKLWGVLNNYCSVEDFVKGEEIKFESALKMRMGTLKHELVQEFLIPEYEIEVKTEYKHKDFILVGKCDAIKKDEILEIKTSDELLSLAKSWHIWQVKMYLSLFNRKTGIILQPVFTKTKLFLKEIGKVEKDGDWFKKELVKIEKLHKSIIGKA